MSNSEATTVAPGFASAEPDIAAIDNPGFDIDTAEAADDLAKSQRIGAWVEAGATSLPAMLIALGSAAAGGVALMVRRHRRR